MQKMIPAEGGVVGRRTASPRNPRSLLLLNTGGQGINPTPTGKPIIPLFSSCKAKSTDWIFFTTGNNCETKHTLRIQHCEVHVKTFQLRNKAARVPLLLQSSGFNAECDRHLPVFYLFVTRQTLCVGMTQRSVLVKQEMLQKRKSLTQKGPIHSKQGLSSRPARGIHRESSELHRSPPSSKPRPASLTSQWNK